MTTPLKPPSMDSIILAYNHTEENRIAWASCTSQNQQINLFIDSFSKKKNKRWQEILMLSNLAQTIAYQMTQAKAHEAKTLTQQYLAQGGDPKALTQKLTVDSPHLTRVRIGAVYSVVRALNKYPLTITGA